MVLVPAAHTRFSKGCTIPPSRVVRAMRTSNRAVTASPSCAIQPSPVQNHRMIRQGMVERAVSAHRYCIWQSFGDAPSSFKAGV